MNLQGQHLVDLINESDLVKSYCGIPADWKDIINVTYNSVHRLVGVTPEGKAIVQARFFSKRKYKDQVTTNMLLALERNGVFKSLEKQYGKEEMWKEYYGVSVGKPSLMKYATSSFNPDAGTGNTTVDGAVGFIDFAGVTWAAIRDAATGTTVSVTDATNSFCRIRTDANTDRWDFFYRSFLLFDTSSLGAAATVDSADLKVFVTSKSDALSVGQSVGVIAVNPAVDNNLTTADYDAVTFTRQASDMTIASITTSAFNTFALNATGISNVSISGISKFGLAIVADIDDAEPTWSASDSADVIGNYADNGSNEPTLDVTFTLSVAASRRIINIS